MRTCLLWTGARFSTDLSLDQKLPLHEQISAEAFVESQRFENDQESVFVVQRMKPRSASSFAKTTS